MFLKMFRTYSLNESAVIHNSSHAYCHIIFIYNIYHILARTEFLNKYHKGISTKDLDI